MPKPVSVTIPHDLGKAEARRRLEQGLGGIQDELTGGTLRMSFQQHWEGDRLHFTGGTFGQNIRGRIDVMEEVVLVEVDLPRLMAALAESLKGRIARRGQQLLENRRQGA